MSKRHQSSRRRTYGRRQHELHEREAVRRHAPLAADLVKGWDGASPSDPLSFLDPRSPRLRYAIGE